VNGYSADKKEEETKTEATSDATTKTENPENPVGATDDDDKPASISSEEDQNDNKEVKTRRSAGAGAGTARRGGWSTIKSGLRGARSDLLDRSRLARLNGSPGTGNNATTSRVFDPVSVARQCLLETFDPLSATGK
jgi:hypothetical protein